MHMVKCKYCNISFDRDKEEAVLVTARRYAHKVCADKNLTNRSIEEKEYFELENYIKSIYGLGILNIQIRKQIKSFKEEYNYTYEGMLKSLKWWFEIQKQPIRGIQDGIGIIPYIYQKAENFNNQISKIESMSKDINVNNLKSKIEYVKIHSPRARKKEKRLFDI